MPTDRQMIIKTKEAAIRLCETASSEDAVIRGMVLVQLIQAETKGKGQISLYFEPWEAFALHLALETAGHNTGMTSSQRTTHNCVLYNKQLTTELIVERGVKVTQVEYCISASRGEGSIGVKLNKPQILLISECLKTLAIEHAWVRH